jgi:soluble P-type ATPase/preprotein translocase subunit Sss1
MIKGAPDILLPRCDTLLDDKNEAVPLTDAQRLRIEQIKDAWSRQGKRVILLARKPTVVPFSSNHEKEVLVAARQGLTFVGIVGIVDPPRDEIPEVVRILRGASIRIFMVTGDFKLTAQAIAEECGIISNPMMVDDISALSRDVKIGSTKQAIVLSGPELITLNENQWDQLCQYQEIVFARTTPEQKLRIVKEFQARENIVGMTGDGVNDAPSLKAADIGIAMGSGSDIAIEAADMVLLDSFAAIVEAVKYGRLVYDNLKKTVSPTAWPNRGLTLTRRTDRLPPPRWKFLRALARRHKRRLRYPADPVIVPDDHYLLFDGLRCCNYLGLRKTRGGCLATSSPQPQEGPPRRHEAHFPRLFRRRIAGVFSVVRHGVLVHGAQGCTVHGYVVEVWPVRRAVRCRLHQRDGEHGF